MIKTPKLVMIPGPTPVVRSIQDQMARETVAFGDARFVADFKGVVADLKSMWRCDGEAFVIAGSGTLAMEMAVSNVTKRGDSISFFHKTILYAVSSYYTIRLTIYYPGSGIVKHFCTFSRNIH